MKIIFILLCALGLAVAPSQAILTCSVEPPVETNYPGDFFSFDVLVTDGATPQFFVDVTYTNLSGPNAGRSGSDSTDANGFVTFLYFSNGSKGTDVIRVIAGNSTCTATAVWSDIVNERPIAFCKNAVIAAGPACATTVPASELDDGSFDFDGEIVDMFLIPPGPFAPGSHNVLFTVEDDYGDRESCEATLTILDITPPAISCPIHLITNLTAGISNAVVTFNTPLASDNCGAPTTSCDPPSGSDFVLGTNVITTTSADNAGNTNTCTFDIILREEPPAPYDFTISKLKAPKTVTFTALTPTVTLPATVTIVNVSTNTETITSLDGLVTLVVQSLGAECANPTVVMRPLATSPVFLAPRKKLNVYFDITFDCVHDPLKGVGHQDYRVLATVDRAALGGGGDSNLVNDDCPRPPNLLTGDKGCGGKGGTPVFIDAVLK